MPELGLTSQPLPVSLPSARPRVLLFDSGVGGLTVFREVRAALPDADLTYVADDAGFPYGGREEGALVSRVVGLMEALIARERPDLVVIACNTASTLVLGPLRARFAVPFVGTVPAIKPAAALTRTGRIAVLATPGTVRRDYTRALIDAHAAGCEVALVGATGLAALAEGALRGEPPPPSAIAHEIAPCFARGAGSARTDVVVMGCTHYPLLVESFRAAAPWRVVWLDPAPAVARRVAALLGRTPGRRAGEEAGEPPRAIFTGAGARDPALARSLAALGIGKIEPHGTEPVRPS